MPFTKMMMFPYAFMLNGLLMSEHKKDYTTPMGSCVSVLTKMDAPFLMGFRLLK
jgi:hypothetical protein